MAPDNVVYDPAAKAYRRADDFTPAFLNDAVEPHLQQLVAIENGWLQAEDTWFNAMPPLEVSTLRRRSTEPSVLLRVLDALHNGLEIDIEYGSLTGSVEPSRTVAPHALAYCAGRWYVRCWSRGHNDFRDYNLNRITSVPDSRPTNADPGLDFEWMHQMDLVILPNPELSQQRQAAVAWEHGMTDGRLVLPCRLSLSYYLMSEHNLDVAPGVLEPQKQQIVLENREEVTQARKLARKMSIEALARAQGADVV